MSGSVASSDLASRIDDGHGIREEIGFFDVGRGRLFGAIHAPLEPTDVGVLMCCPVGAEFDKNYRREVLLARELAARGIAAARFHYLGTGQSDGEPSALTFESMLEDARAFADRFVERVGIETLALFGTRLGGVVAAGTAAQIPGTLLALWQPTLDGDRYFREIFRARLVAELRAGDGKPSSRDALVEEMRRQGWLDVVGYTITFPFYESLAGLRLDEVAGMSPRPALILQLGANRPVERGYRVLVDRWREFGWDVEFRVVETEKEAWWLGEQRRDKTALVDETGDYLAARLHPREGTA